MTYAAAAAGLVLLALAPVAQAQTWGQPVYLNQWGRPVGGTPVSEVETRAYVETGRWAGGYSERPYVYVPGAYSSHGHDRYGYRRDDRRYGRHGSDWRSSGSRVGYRDEWGYQDDRPPTTTSRRGGRYGYGHGRDCGCADVYLYDR